MARPPFGRLWGECQTTDWLTNDESFQQSYKRVRATDRRASPTIMKHVDYESASRPDHTGLTMAD